MGVVSSAMQYQLKNHLLASLLVSANGTDEHKSDLLSVTLTFTSTLRQQFEGLQQEEILVELF